jgi:hypothetical protein
MQLSDLLLGSITSSLNAKTKSAGKLALADYLASRLGRRPATPTHPGESKFNVWYFRAGPAGIPG